MGQVGSGTLKLPVLNRESDERGTYVRRDWAMERLRDHLPAERLRVTECPYYSNAGGNAPDTGKGHRRSNQLDLIVWWRPRKR
jgi:hypothetical protein